MDSRHHKMLSFLRHARAGKITSYATICRESGLMRDMHNVLNELVRYGYVVKHSRGYRAAKSCRKEVLNEVVAEGTRT